MVEVIINGISSPYPPVISAIRKIPVSGACMTPAINPDIPTNVKLLSEKLKKGKPFNNLAKKYPTKPPVNNAGAKNTSYTSSPRCSSHCNNFK